MERARERHGKQEIGGGGGGATKTAVGWLISGMFWHRRPIGASSNGNEPTEPSEASLGAAQLNLYCRSPSFDSTLSQHTHTITLHSWRTGTTCNLLLWPKLLCLLIKSRMRMLSSKQGASQINKCCLYRIIIKDMKIPPDAPNISLKQKRPVVSEQLFYISHFGIIHSACWRMRSFWQHL